MFKSNCHTHTIYCDGKNTAKEMIEAAIEKGFVSLGFSGHCPMKNKNDWTMSAENTKRYIDEINALKKEYAGKIDILCGIELDNCHDEVNPGDFDFAIGSVHQFEKDGVFYDIDYTAERLKKAVDEIFDGSFNKMSRCYYDTLSDFIINTDVDIVGHIDLITKFNLDTVLFDESDCEYRRTVFETVDRILDKKPDIIFEVNTGAMYRMGKATPYPAEFILRYISDKGGKITLTSDSHNTESIDFAFTEAEKIIKKCGFKEIIYLTSTGMKIYEV